MQDWILQGLENMYNCLKRVVLKLGEEGWWLHLS